jgi:hypothetical protein
MSDLKETCLNHVAPDKHMTFCSSEQKWVNKISKLKDQHPNEVEIVRSAEENDGMVYAKLPLSWLKISPPRQVNYTEEQKAAMAERLAAARSNKL